MDYSFAASACGALFLTRKLNDNHHNSFPTALTRVAQLARDALPVNPTPADLESAEIDAHKCDLTNAEQVRAVFENYGRVGFGALSTLRKSPLEYYANNVVATTSLLQIMSAYDCTRIVYSSSATVYGTPPKIPIPETTRLKADSPYGRSKVMSEMIIEDLCHGKYLGSDGTLLALTKMDSRATPLFLTVFCSPAGAHPSGLIGEDPRGRPGNLLPLLAQMAIGRIKDDTLK
ncbi:hypothetical protein EDD17DRAFT_1517112, partial [Pisolithus thermaeus]